MDFQWLGIDISYDVIQTNQELDNEIRGYVRNVTGYTNTLV